MRRLFGVFLLIIRLIVAHGQSAALQSPVNLPVVVHVVNTNPYAMTDAQIEAGVADMNDFFRKAGIYAGSMTVDTKLGFCLAKVAPDGSATTGITRTYSVIGKDYNPTIDAGKLAAIMEWDPSRYINIWLIDNMQDEALAQYQCGHWVRVNTGALGGPGGIITPGFGSVIHHEMGHYFSLLHTFGTGCKNDNCEVDGDGVCDTPPDRSFSSSPCSSPENSCNTDTASNYSNGYFPKDAPDDIFNVMDYGGATGSCPGTSTRFTPGQAQKMQNFYLNSKASLGAMPSKCASPCPTAIVAAFTKDVDDALPGASIHFTNSSTGATSYTWLVDDVPVATSTDYTQTFPAVGKFKITLRAISAGGCVATYDNNVFVTCGVKARFYTDKEAIASRASTMADSAVFTNTSENASSYAWLVKKGTDPEFVYSTDKDIKYTFPEPGDYTIRLAVANGACVDTTKAFPYKVENPDADVAMYYPGSECVDSTTIKVKVCIWNFGYAALPVGTPISFFDGDPRKPGAKKLGNSYYFTKELVGSPSGDCYTCIEHLIPGRRIDFANKNIFFAINTEGKTLPLDFKDAFAIEKNYNNNVTATRISYPSRYDSICQGGSVNGHTSSGTYVDTLVDAVNGCLSLDTLHLTVLPVYTRKDTVTICYGQQYLGHTVSGDYIDPYTAKNGCDSSFITHLTVLPLLQTTIDSTVCEGVSVFGYSSTGNYRDVFKSVTNCDSTRILRLIVHPVARTIINIELCEGDSANIQGRWQTIAGTYRDTLTTWLGCDSIVTTNLAVHPLPRPDLGDDRGICENSRLALYPGDFATYRWSNGASTSQITVDQVGTYFVEVRNAFQCVQSDSFRLTAIYPLPRAFLPADTTLCPTNFLSITVPGYIEYHWNTNSQAGAEFSITAPGRYVLTVTDDNGCIGTDDITVQYIDKCIPAQVPNAFTPNGDGKNDVFRPRFNVPVSNYSMSIYNRFGQVVFHTNDWQHGWNGQVNGRLQDSGTYVYVITYTDLGLQKIALKGALLLIR